MKGERVILFKLLLIPIFLIIVFITIKIAMFFYKLADDMEIDEKKNDIKHKAELVEEVEDYVNANGERIKKASSDAVKDFIKK